MIDEKTDEVLVEEIKRLKSEVIAAKRKARQGPSAYVGMWAGLFVFIAGSSVHGVMMWAGFLMGYHIEAMPFYLSWFIAVACMGLTYGLGKEG